MAKRIGELLVEAGVLSQSQLEQALFAQRKDGRKLGHLLIELGLVTETQLTQTLSRQLSVPWVSLYHVDFSRSLLNLVSREIAERFSLVPIFVRRVRKQGETLYVAMDDPTLEGAIEDVAAATGLSVRPMIACPSDIRAAIRVYYLGEAPPPPASPQVVHPRPVAHPASPSGGPSPATPRATPAAGSPDPTTPRRETAVLQAVPALRGGDGVPGPNAPGARPAAKAAPAPPGPAAPSSAGTSDVSAAAAGTPSGAREGGDAPDSSGSVDREARDSADSAPDIEATESEFVAPPRARKKMISLTLLDGTSIAIPAPGQNTQGGTAKAKPADSARPRGELTDQLTARDLVSALRAVAHGADASEILGQEPRWEALFSTLLSLMLRKGLIADWEFIEEFQKI